MRLGWNAYQKLPDFPGGQTDIDTIIDTILINKTHGTNYNILTNVETMLDNCIRPNKTAFTKFCSTNLLFFGIQVICHHSRTNIGIISNLDTPGNNTIITKRDIIANNAISRA